jgi:carboxylesterase
MLAKTPPSRATSPPAGDGLSFLREGANGTGVLLIHGVTGSPVEMKYVAKGLHRRGYTVYAPLLAGHGRDMEALRRTRWQDWYDTVAQSAYLLSALTDRVVVAGVCMGGLLGLHLARDQACVRAIAAYSALLQYDGWNMPYHYRAGRLTVPVALALGFGGRIALKERSPFGIKSERIRRLLGDGIRGTLPAYPLETLQENLRLITATRALLPKVKKPTLLVHARQDDVAGSGNPLAIQREIGGPCEIAWLENSYHMIHVDQEHASVCNRTGEFFDRIS